MGKQMTFNAKKGTNIYIFFRPFGEKTRRKLPVGTQKERKCRKWLGTKTLNDAPGGGGGQVWVGRRCVFGQGCRKRRKTAKVTENEAILGVRTDHHHSSPTRLTRPPPTPTHTYTHRLWSEVHLQFALTITTPRRKGAEGRAQERQERSDVVSGGKEGGNEGEVEKEGSD